jgi:hypothetical protein
MPNFSFDEKLDRANQHLKELWVELRRWRESRPYLITDELDTKSGDNVVYAKMRGSTPPVILTLIGDCLYNFRSSLDHLVHALAVEHMKRPLTDAESIITAFPIFKDLAGFKKKGARRIRYLAPRAQAVIERLQPYHAANPTSHPLWFLNQLNNIDKHRRLLVTFFTTIGASTQMPNGARQVSFGWGRAFALTQRKTIVARYQCVTLDGSRRVKMEVHPALEVIFGDAPARGEFVVVVLDELLHTISQNIIPRFRPFL